MRWFLAFGLLFALTGFASADDKGAPVTIDGLTSKAPGDWKEKPPASQMQFKVFALPKAEGDAADATLTIYFFGQGQGGDVKANVARWKGMFKAPAGKSIDDIAKQDDFTVSGVKITRVDLNGTYLYKRTPMDTEVTEKPDHRMIGVVFESKGGNYYMRLVGPEKTVAKHAKGFEEWLKNFK